MIRYTAFLLVAFLLETLTSEAQPKSSYTGTININPVRVLQAGKNALRGNGYYSGSRKSEIGGSG